MTTTAFEREHVYLILRSRRDKDSERETLLIENAILHDLDIETLLANAEPLPTEIVKRPVLRSA